MLFGEPAGLSHHTLTANSINQHYVIALMNHLGHDKVALVGHHRSPGGNRFAKARPGYWFFKFLTHFYRDWSYNPEMLSPEKVDVYLWGAEFNAVGKAYDVLELWKTFAANVRGVAIPECGHLCDEERPDVVNHELAGFLADWKG